MALDMAIDGRYTSQAPPPHRGPALGSDPWSWKEPPDQGVPPPRYTEEAAEAQGGRRGSYPRLGGARAAPGQPEPRRGRVGTTKGGSRVLSEETAALRRQPTGGHVGTWALRSQTA